MKDSYTIFFEKGYVSKKAFFAFGLEETIYPSCEQAEEAYNSLLNSIFNNKEAYIRGFGRDASGTPLFFELYKEMVGNVHIKKDPTNNSKPTKVLEDLTGYSKKKKKSYKLLSNYQVSHVFGRTKNVFAFTAPWNVVYTPKLLDPFTGHEAKGDYVDVYKALFQQKSYERFEKLIIKFNKIMRESFSPEELLHVVSQMNLDEKTHQKLLTSVLKEFRPINIS